MMTGFFINSHMQLRAKLPGKFFHLARALKVPPEVDDSVLVFHGNHSADH